MTSSEAKQGRKLNRNETTKTIAETRMVTSQQMTKRRTDFHTRAVRSREYVFSLTLCVLASSMLECSVFAYPSSGN